MERKDQMEILTQDILAFWFGDLATDGAIDPIKSKPWFEKNKDFDEQVKRRYESYLDTAVMGAFDRWIRSPEGLTALVILLDQFPRHIYREKPKSFLFDAKALSMSLYGIEQKLFLETRSAYGYFMLMPTMHAEDLAIQTKSVECFERLFKVAEQGAKDMIAKALDFSLKHKAIIERFGRFPHRNAILGRTSTESEIEFLKEPGSSF